MAVLYGLEQHPHELQQNKAPVVLFSSRLELSWSPFNLFLGGLGTLDKKPVPKNHKRANSCGCLTPQPSVLMDF